MAGTGNYVLDEYYRTLAAQQGLQQGEQNIIGTKKLNTLRDLQIQDEQSKLAPGSPENLMRRVGGMKAQAMLNNRDVYAKTLGFQNEAEMYAAADDVMQRRLDRGENGQTVVDDLVSQGMLPQGMQAKKIYDPELGRSVWNTRAPKPDGTMGPWAVFNKEAVKMKEDLSAKKSLAKYTADAEASAKLNVLGYEWTKDGKMRIIPDGPADPHGKSFSWDGLKGAPMLVKLQQYRQHLIDTNADPKLVREVENVINKPDTVNQILAGYVKAAAKGHKFTQEELNALDVIKSYGNLLADAVGDSIEGGLKQRLEAGGELPRAPSSPHDFMVFYDNLEPGQEFIDPDGNQRTKPKE